MLLLESKALLVEDVGLKKVCGVQAKTLQNLDQCYRYQLLDIAWDLAKDVEKVLSAQTFKREKKQRTCHFFLILINYFFNIISKVKQPFN